MDQALGGGTEMGEWGSGWWHGDGWGSGWVDEQAWVHGWVGHGISGGGVRGEAQGFGACSFKLQDTSCWLDSGLGLSTACPNTLMKASSRYTLHTLNLNPGFPRQALDSRV